MADNRLRKTEEEKAEEESRDRHLSLVTFYPLTIIARCVYRVQNISFILSKFFYLCQNFSISMHYSLSIVRQAPTLFTSRFRKNWRYIMRIIVHAYDTD